MSQSSGFRGPQAFDEDLHVKAVGGDVALISLNPDLKPERSQSLSASIDIYKNFGSVRTNLLIEGFYTRLNNVFILQEIGRDIYNNLLLERRNGPGAYVVGVNIEARILPTTNMQVNIGYTYQNSRYVEPLTWSEDELLDPQKKMFRSPDSYGCASANDDNSKQWTALVTGMYRGSMLVHTFA